MVDVLFITRLSSPEGTETTGVYRDIRLVLNGRTATIDYLRRLAASPSPEENTTPEDPAQEHLFPVLTPIHMSEFLKKHGISMVEIPSLENDIEKARAYLREGVRVIALCTTWLKATDGATQIRQAAKLLKSIAPGTPLVVGGIGALKGLRVREMLQENRLTGVFPRWVETNRIARKLSSGLLKRVLSPHILLIDGHADTGIDGIVLNDTGEVTLVNIVESLKAGKGFQDIPNLAIPDGRDYRFTGRVEIDVDLDTQNIDWTGYVPGLNRGEAPVRRATGCPYRCNFCDFQGLQKLRMRSPESMIAELKTLNGAGHRKVYFVDDNIAYTRKHLVEFTRAIIDGRVDISWRTFLRADTIDGETAALLGESGCREILLGVESGDPQVIENMNKGTDPEKVLAAIRLLDAQGIRTQSTFVVGFPGECARSIDNTAAFVSAFPSGKNARVFHRYYMFKFMVSPLSPIAGPELREKYSLRGIAGNWSHSTMNSREAVAAMRELFLKVKGPSHIYGDTFPDEWNTADIRKVIELRDEVQKEKLRGCEEGNVEKLLAAVRSAEQGSTLT